jgi:hypothetical protein
LTDIWRHLVVPAPEGSNHHVNAEQRGIRQRQELRNFSLPAQTTAVISNFRLNPPLTTLRISFNPI